MFLVRTDMVEDAAVSLSLIYGVTRPREPGVRIQMYAETTVQCYNDSDFKEHFRLTRKSFFKLLAAVENTGVVPTPENHLNRGKLPIDLEKRLLVTLWYTSNQCCIRDVADCFNITRSSVKRTTSRILMALQTLANEYIVWLSGDYKDKVIRGIYDMKGIWGVIGLIGGCHLEIPTQKHDKAAYINRKGFSSIILQGICDNELRFTNVNVGFPGSVHNARVLRRSQIYQAAEDVACCKSVFPNESFLLADPAYPCLSWLMVPFKDIGRLNASKRSYNYNVSATRVHIERAFGQLKGRFRKLRFIDMASFEEIDTLVIACCVIHNICIDSDDTIEDIDDACDIDLNHFEGIYADAADGNAKRDQLVDLLVQADD